MGTPVLRSQTSALTGRQSDIDRVREIILGTATGGLPIGAGDRSGIEWGPTLDTTTYKPPSYAPTGFLAPINYGADGRISGGGVRTPPLPEFDIGPLQKYGTDLQNADYLQGITQVGQNAYQQYLDEMNDAWRLQEQDIKAQYQPNLDAANDQLGDLQSQLAQSNAAYGDFEAGMAGLDTDIPYGSISEADADRVSRHYDEAEGRLARALNIMPDEMSNAVVGELRLLEDTATTMLMDDINATEQLHDLGGVYAQAIADEAYSMTTLEGQRAKLEMQAQFDKAIEDAKKEIARLKKAMADAISRSREQFDFNYPDFDINREAVTKAAFDEWASVNGMSVEDAGQAWTMYQNIYNEHSGQIGNQTDFDSFVRNSLNDSNFQLIDLGMWTKLNDAWEIDPASMPMTDAVEVAMWEQVKAAHEVMDWLSRNDLSSKFGGQFTLGQLPNMLRRAGMSGDDISAFIARGKDLASTGAMMGYNSPEAEAARNAYQITKITDDHWEEIYYGSMTIPVDSKYIYRDAGTGAVFPIAGPEIWHTSHAAFNYNDPRDWVHKGADYHSQKGTPVLSVLPGSVKASGWNKTSGNYVIVDHGGGRVTKYMHLADRSPFQVGAKVDGGTSLGRVGNTGSASGTGYHLHFEYWEGSNYVDPRTLFNYGDHPYGTAAPANNNRGVYDFAFDIMRLFT